MNFGKLDREITLLAPEAPPQNQFGELAPQAYAEAATVWAKVEYPQGQEVQQAEQLTAVQPVRFTIRYRPGLTTTWQVGYQGQTYQLTAVAEIGRRAGLTLTGYSRG